MTFEILKTGSKGNAVLIGSRREILVDCGVGMKLLEPYADGLKLVLLTHIHGDHCAQATIKALSRRRPTLRFCCGDFLAESLLEAGVDKRSIDVCGEESALHYPTLSAMVQTFPLVHDVPNVAWLLKLGRETLFYATDTGTLDHIQAPGCDLYLIEANHTKEALEARKKAKLAAGRYAYESRAAATHLSREQAMDWLCRNMSPNSQYVFLHQHEEQEGAPCSLKKN